MTTSKIEDCTYGLYDEYCRGHIDRRTFFRRAGEVTVAGAATMLFPNCAEHVT